MIKKIIILLLIILGVVAYLKSERDVSPISTYNATTTPTITGTSTPVNKPTPTKDDNSIRNSAWKVFEAYTLAVQAKNIEEVKQLSYQISEACLDQNKINECEDRMATAYNFAKQFKYEDMKYIAYDDKQIILSGDYFESLDGTSPSFVRGVLYFIRDGSNIKFLSLNPFLGAIVIREENEATSTVRDRLLDATEDQDLDYQLDVFEKCIGMSALPGCVQTDPKKRDTDGDGWWDSTESLFYKQPTQ